MGRYNKLELTAGAIGVIGLLAIYFLWRIYNG